jgi:membrane protein YdbS with pleckstrin-like domain
MKVDIPVASFKCSRINLKRHKAAAWHLLCLIGCILAACTLHFVVLLAFPNTPFFAALLLLIAFTFVFVYTHLYRETRATQ